MWDDVVRIRFSGYKDWHISRKFIPSLPDVTKITAQACRGLNYNIDKLWTTMRSGWTRTGGMDGDGMIEWMMTKMEWMKCTCVNECLLVLSFLFLLYYACNVIIIEIHDYVDRDDDTTESRMIQAWPCDLVEWKTCLVTLMIQPNGSCVHCQTKRNCTGCRCNSLGNCMCMQEEALESC